MLAGTVTMLLPLDRLTTMPPDRAVALKVTVPVEELPPTTVLGFSRMNRFTLRQNLGQVYRGEKASQAVLNAYLNTSFVQNHLFAAARLR